jgi:hypothetical protein
VKAPRRRRPRQSRPDRVPEEAQRESRLVDFKQSVNVDSTGDWCELVKDIVAMANSGGGAVVVGVRDDGKPAGADCTALLAFDPAKVVDKIASYTGEQFAEFEIRGGRRAAQDVAVIEVQGVFPPLAFVKAGNYQAVMPDGTKMTKVAFQAGTVYFRHGAKSEPTNSHDLRSAFERRLVIERKALMSNVRKVVAMPAGAEVRVVPGDQTRGDDKAMPFRLVDDERAPGVRAPDFDKAYPFRRKEVVVEVNKRLDAKKKVGPFDIQCVRKVYEIDGKAMYSGALKYGSRQYSDAFIDWIVAEYQQDNSFFDKARKAATER